MTGPAPSNDHPRSKKPIFVNSSGRLGGRPRASSMRSTAQKLPPGAPRILNPRTRVGLSALRLGLRAASSGPAKKLGNRFFSPPADRIELPDHAHLERTPGI